MLGFDFGKAAQLNRYIRDFQQLQKLGSGGFSTVYKVRNKLDNRQYAMKVIQIKPSLYKTDIYQHFQKMLNQAKILASLNHSNVIKYHGCWIQCDEKTPEDFQNQYENTASTGKTNKKDYSQQSDCDFQMIMYDDDSNSGIQFVHDSQDNKKQTNKSIDNESPKLKKNNSTKRSTLQNQSLFGQGNIFEKYQKITVYIQTELCSMSLQHLVEKRNFQRQSSNSQQSIKKDSIQNYKIILQIIRGLSYIHSRKIIHRDLKLQNIIIDSKGKSKIIDFGLAKKVRSFGSVHVDPIYSQKAHIQSSLALNEQQLNQKYSSSVGTKIFSSPEQASTNKYDHRTDIYSLGMVIAVLFSKFTTVHGERQLLLNIRNKNLEQIKMDCRLKQILIRCLSQEKIRPSLQQLSQIVKVLLREQLQISRNPKKSFGCKDQQNPIQNKKRQYKAEFCQNHKSECEKPNLKKQALINDLKKQITMIQSSVRKFSGDTEDLRQQSKFEKQFIILKSCSQWCYEVTNGGHFYRKRKILQSQNSSQFEHKQVEPVGQ